MFSQPRIVLRYMLTVAGRWRVGPYRLHRIDTIGYPLILDQLQGCGYHLFVYTQSTDNGLPLARVVRIYPDS